MSEIGKQGTIISENSNKKDFSTLYSNLQSTLSDRQNPFNIFGQRIKQVYNNNKNKTFPTEDIISLEDAKSTINIIAKFVDKAEIKNKAKYDIINSIASYDDILQTLTNDEDDSPIHCKGQCIGFCNSTCYEACSGKCKSEGTADTYNNDSCGGNCTGTCNGSCSSECDRNCNGCGSSCSGKCVGCSNSCNDGCAGKCKGGCTGGCAGCTGNCGDSCSGGAS